MKSATEPIKKRFFNLGFFTKRANTKQINIQVSGVIKKLRILDNQKNIGKNYFTAN